ncbi:MFS transporter [Pandoraea sp. NPDC090278]|uniref:MFS transporter n=1 Tax=Pandoraea sp. NPDC090278 TaxID=3364391 RepID=UPI00383A4EC8
MFDWANQPYFTVISTFIFAPYFVSSYIGDPIQGQALWGAAISSSALLVGVGAPIVGAIVDVTGNRKCWLACFQVVLCCCCCLLWMAEPGRLDMLPVILVAIVISNVSAEYSATLNNAMLPEIVSPRNIGRLSGIGWSLGYVGGLIALCCVIVASRHQPILGLGSPPGSYQIERSTGPATALWLTVFVLPMFLFTPGRRRATISGRAAITVGIGRLIETFRNIRRHENVFIFLLAYMIAYDGLITIISFGGIYAANLFGWGSEELGIFGILITTIAIPSVFVCGALEDRFSSKKIIQLSILIIFFSTLGILSITKNSIFFGVPTPQRAEQIQKFGSIGEQVFLAFAMLLGIGMGPLQAASRSLVARLSPPDKVGEFFGIFALSGRATSFLAPLIVTIALPIFKTQRVTPIVVLFFLITGFLLMSRVSDNSHR